MYEDLKSVFSSRTLEDVFLINEYHYLTVTLFLFLFEMCQVQERAQFAFKTVNRFPFSVPVLLELQE